MSHSDTYSNPWEDVLITVVFTSPSSSTYTVGGFYYDTDTWKLRFAPVEEGSWTWVLTFDNGSETFVDAGGFNCVSSDKSGFLRVHPQNPYRFVTDTDNKSFYPMGFNDVIYDQAGPKGFGGSSDGTLNSDWWMDAEYVGWPIDYYFDTFADAGNNMFRMNTQTNTYLLYDKLNISGTGKNSYLVPEGKLTDQLAQKLHEGGWKFYMVFWQKPNLGWDLSDANVRQATLSYHKYIIDRWGVYVDIWELMNERSSQDDRYFDYVATFIRDWDPYDHIISTSNARPDLACIEINSPHRYNGNDTRDIHRLLASNIRSRKAAYFKPALYGEFGNSYPPYTNYDPERYRIFIWTAMFNEAALVFWHTGYAKNYQSGAGNMFIGPEERAFSRILSWFTIDFDALAMPIPVALSPSVEIYASALGSGQDIGIYFTHSTSYTTTLSGATVTLDIPDDGMQGLWLDPSMGNVLQTFTVNSGSQTLTIPDFRVDIALRIRGAGSNWAPVTDTGADKGVIDSDDNGSEDVDLLFDDMGVSAIFTYAYLGHEVVDPVEEFPVLIQAKNHGVQHFHAAMGSPPQGWKSGANLLPEYYDDFANYILDYTNYIKKNTGVEFTEVCPNNEPGIGTPGEVYHFRISIAEYPIFLRVAGPILRNGLNSNVKILAPDDWNINQSILYANAIMADPVARNYVDVLSTHTYNWGLPNPIHSSSPELWRTFAAIAQNYNKPVAHTETWLGGSNNPISSLNAYRTSTTENTESLGQISVTENSFTYTLPRESITTFTGP